jgi:putative membrane protein
MKTIIRFLVSTIAILITAYILPGVHLNGIITALVLAVVLGVINIFLRPVIIFLTLPISVMTLGLFTLVINGALVMLASYIVPGFTVANFWWALLFSIVVTLINYVLQIF